MDITSIILISILIVIGISLIIILFYIIKRMNLLETELKKSSTEGKVDPTSINILHNTLQKIQDDVQTQKEGIQNTIYDLKEKIEGKMNESQQNISSSLLTSSKTLSDLREDLGKVKEAQKQIRNLDDSIKRIQGIFASPKLRGIAAEFTLETILEDVLPGQWKKQHYFSDNKVVDAVVKVGKKLVPIDSKFPLDKYRAFVDADDKNTREASRKELNRAIIDNINSISEKYIRPEENTMDFALLYVPSNKMYYEIFLHEETLRGENATKIFELSTKKKVFPVCPANLFIYLQAIALGLKGMKIEENAQKIIKRLENISKKFEKFTAEFGKLEPNIRKIQNQYDKVQNRFRLFTDEIDRILRLKEIDIGS